MKRREFVSAESSSQSREMHAPVLIAQPIVHHAASVFFLLLLVAGVTFCIFPQFSRQETVRGEVIASSGFTVLTSDSSGTVLQLLKKVGDPVRAGDVVATLRLARPVAQGRDTVEEVTTNLANSLALVKQQITETGSKLRTIATERPRIEAAFENSLQSLTGQRELSLKSLNIIAERRAKMIPLGDKGFVALSTMDQLETYELGARKEERAIELQIIQLRQAGLQQRLTMDEESRAARLALSDLQQRELQFEAQIQAAKATDVVELRANADGEIAALHARPGKRVSPGEELIAISQPKSGVSVLLNVPSSAIGHMKIGDAVNLKYDAFPFATYGIQRGAVAAIDRASLNAGETTADTGSPASRRTFAVDVVPERQAVLVGRKRAPLRIGMELTADVLVERRSLFGWWVEPLIEFSGRSR